MQERELIRLSLEGDEKAFEALVLANREQILHHCISIVHDTAAAEDLTQETFLKAYQHLKDFHQEARFSTWVWRIAHNLSLNYLKKHQPLESEFKEEILVPESTPDVRIDEERMKKIQNALGVLSSKHRIVFEMYFFQKIPQKQIAAQLGIPHGTVRSRLHYARKKVKELTH